MAKLKISDDLSLPDDVLGQTQAILAIKGAGKSYAAMKMMEETVASGYQAVAIDPTGVWWGLSADGDGKGLPVLVMGGEHGNVPLEQTSGEVVAEFIVDSSRSVVLDLSLMRKAEMHRFMAAFLDRLYHYKATHRESVHVFFDEADTAAPQQPGPEQAKVLGAAEDVVRRGRSRGLGMTLITQRPAVLNKNLLEMADVLYVMRVIGANDQDAIRKRIRVDADDATVDKMMGSLASLSNGEAWVWSPSTLGTLKRIRFAKRRTSDSGRTPKAGERQQLPKARAAINLDDLTARIKATVDRAKDNDPKLLKGELSRLRAELSKAQSAKPDAEVRTIEKPVVTDAQVKAVEGIVQRLEREGKERIAAADDLRRSGELLVKQGGEFAAALRMAAARPASSQTAGCMDVVRQQGAERRQGTPPQNRIVAAGLGEPMGKAERLALTALAQYPDGRTKIQVAVLSGYAHTGGGFNNALSAARGKGWLEGSGDRLVITSAGIAALGEYEPLPTGAALLDHWRGQVGKAEREILDVLADAYPARMTKEEVARRTPSQYTPNGGGFNNALSRLRTLELIEGRGEMKASDNLFDGVAV